MSPTCELPLLLTWYGREERDDASVLALAFLPGRTQIVGLERRGSGPGSGLSPGPAPTVGGGSGAATDPVEVESGCWQIPLTTEEHRVGELPVLVRYRLSPPLVSSLRLLKPQQLAGAWSAQRGGIIAQTRARCQNGQLLEGDLRRAFDWFSAFELRSNDELLEAHRTDGREGLEETISLIGGCRAELTARLKARAELVLSRRLLREASRSDHFVELASHYVAPVSPPGEQVPTLEIAVRALGDAAAAQLRLHANKRPEFQRRLLSVRDRVLDAADSSWRDLEPAEIGRCFRLFAQGCLRLDDQLQKLNAEPDSAFFFLFAEMAISLAELPDTVAGRPSMTPDERQRWKLIARELVVAEHLYRRAYSPGSSLLVDDFDAFNRANLDRDPRRRTTDEELDKLSRIYAALEPSTEAGWKTIVDDHALLVGLACPGWLTPWAELSERLAGELRQVRVPADGSRGEGHTVRLFARHVISAFAELPHGALDGQRSLSALGLTGERVVHLAESLRGYVRRRSQGTQTLMASELRGRTVDQVLRLVVVRCRLRTKSAGDGLPFEGGTDDETPV